MSERHYKWKDIRKTPDRLNAFLQPKKGLPTKFAPSKERSHSVDVLFENSRSRLHTSAEMRAMDLSREESIRDRPMGKESSLKKEDMSEKKLTISKFPTLELGNRISTLTGGQTNNFFQQSNAVVTELKKEFWAFKQNVLRELQRQKDLIQKFMKEIVLTMELEWEKMGRSVREGEVGVKEGGKSLEQWKGELRNVQLASTTDQGFKVENTVKYYTSPNKFTRNQQDKRDTLLPPPKPLLDVGYFLDNVTKLKKSFNELDKLLLQTGKSVGKAVKI